MDPLERTIAAAVAGDEGAWQELVRAVVPRIQAIARAHSGLRTRGLARNADDVAEVTTRCLERLASNDKRTLARYLALREVATLEQPPSFDAWLYGAVDFSVRDHLRRRFGRAPTEVERASGRSLPSRRDLGSAADRLPEERLPGSIAKQLGVTTRLTLAEICVYLATDLAPDEVRALELHYLEGQSFEEIAVALALDDARAAERLIRRIHARLRHRFASDRA